MAAEEAQHAIRHAQSESQHSDWIDTSTIEKPDDASDATWLDEDGPSTWWNHATIFLNVGTSTVLVATTVLLGWMGWRLLSARSHAARPKVRAVDAHDHGHDAASRSRSIPLNVESKTFCNNQPKVDYHCQRDSQGSSDAINRHTLSETKSNGKDTNHNPPAEPKQYDHEWKQDSVGEKKEALHLTTEPLPSAASLDETVSLIDNPSSASSLALQTKGARYYYSLHSARSLSKSMKSSSGDIRRRARSQTRDSANLHASPARSRSRSVTPSSPHPRHHHGQRGLPRAFPVRAGLHDSISPMPEELKAAVKTMVPPPSPLSVEIVDKKPDGTLQLTDTRTRTHTHTGTDIVNRTWARRHAVSSEDSGTEATTSDGASESASTMPSSASASVSASDQSIARDDSIGASTHTSAAASPEHPPHSHGVTSVAHATSSSHVQSRRSIRLRGCSDLSIQRYEEIANSNLVKRLRAAIAQSHDHGQMHGHTQHEQKKQSSRPDGVGRKHAEVNR